MKIQIECPELDNFLDTESVPQTHVDLAYLEHTKALNGQESYHIAMTLFWLGLESKTLREGRN